VLRCGLSPRIPVRTDALQEEPSAAMRLSPLPPDCGDSARAVPGWCSSTAGEPSIRATWEPSRSAESEVLPNLPYHSFLSARHRNRHSRGRGAPSAPASTWRVSKACLTQAFIAVHLGAGPIKASYCGLYLAFW